MSHKHTYHVRDTAANRVDVRALWAHHFALGNVQLYVSVEDVPRGGCGAAPAAFRRWAPLS